MAYESCFPQRLKAARKKKAISQTELGRRMGLESTSASARMNQYESGRHQPDFNMAKKIAEQLDVPVAYLYCDSDDMADLILKFSKLSQDQRAAVLAFVATQNKSDSP
ncbi:helix-turn-helix domain-containing protein [Rheinheimera sp.]|uniref:helix-turn-helix domain-containing protein n=1 Tax=Rheinheimera sp. TaxID=1869214 RepID=UPI003D288B0B